MKFTLPELCLVLLIGPSGAGKSTFAKRFFKSTEVLSSDFFRGLISDDESNQAASPQAFHLLHLVASKRLMFGRLTVIDATNVDPGSRLAFVRMAERYHVQTVAIVFLLPEKSCQEKNRLRKDRRVEATVISQQYKQMLAGLPHLTREGHLHIYTVRSDRILKSLKVERAPLAVNRRTDSGPFDIIGDVHGCYEELLDLLKMLEYKVSGKEKRFSVIHPHHRKLIFLGDVGNRGPQTVEVLRLIMDVVASGTGLCVAGNHDISLLENLKGTVLDRSFFEVCSEIDRDPPGFRARVVSFLDSLLSHYVLDGGRLIVAHAGLERSMHGRVSQRIYDAAVFGEGRVGPRRKWVREYRGEAIVVFGHTPVSNPTWLNNTIDIDTGCVYGGRLTALRYPEKELVSVPSRRVYYEKEKPIPEK